MDGIAVRAPVATGSLTDLVVQLGRDTTADEVNARLRGGGGPGRCLASSSTRTTRSCRPTSTATPYSCIFDSPLTMAHGSTVKVFGWYDNEWGYSCRLVDLIPKLLP